MATSTHRSSHGLDTPRSEQPWILRARCAEPGMDPERWSVPDGLAVHECRRHCPVAAECRADARANPYLVAGTIRGGTFYGGTKAEPKPAKFQPVEELCDDCDPAGQLREAAKRRDEHLRPHGTLAAVRRHQYHKERLCSACLELEADRARRHRRREAAA